MSEDKGFTVRDRRKVKLDESSAETGGDRSEERHEDAAPGSDQGAARESAQRSTLPPVDFTGFVFGLGQMALVHLGEIPEPHTGQVERNLEQARHVIDILDMLEEKTRGNLAQEEGELLQTLKSELKLKYVKTSNLE
jgi:hypothetical protein